MSEQNLTFHINEPVKSVLTFDGDLTGVVLTFRMREDDGTVDLIDVDLSNLGPTTSFGNTVTKFRLSIPVESMPALATSRNYEYKVQDAAGVVAARGQVYVATEW